MIDLYGKGLTQETSIENLLGLIKDNIRCGKGGIYPSPFDKDKDKWKSFIQPSILIKMMCRDYYYMILHDYLLFYKLLDIH